MCGIFGARYRRRPVVERRVAAALARMADRGPDAAGAWFSADRSTALGHRRLSLIAPHNGAQPITNEDETLRLVVNGEFYNFEHLRDRLRSSGHRFRTDSDSEIALHLYEDLGLNFVRELRGEFALILYDEPSRRLIAVRDRFGVKPLVYAYDLEGIMLASNAKALFAAGAATEWDHEAFYQAATMQYPLPDQTWFRGIRQLPPASILIDDDAGQRVERYWRLPERDPATSPTVGTVPPRRDEQESIEHCREAVVDAITLRMRADVPACCHLSGGLDSSIVLGVMAGRSSRPIDAFTVAFDVDSYDEASTAAEAAECCGAALHVVPVSTRSVLEFLPAAVTAAEGLCINGHLTAKYLLHQDVHRAGFKIVLTGEGADELFAGYGHLRADLWCTQGHDELLATLAATNRTSLGMMIPVGEALDLALVRSRLGFVPAWLEAKATFGKRVRSLLHDDFLTAHRSIDTFARFLDAVEASDGLRGFHPVEQATRLWTRSALPNYILSTLGDGTEMAHSVEGRVPYLDHRLWEELADVPLDLKIRGTTEKYVLREGLRDFVPERIYRREKHPFDAPPVGLFSQAHAHAWFRDRIENATFAEQPFFEPAHVRRLLGMLAEADDAARLIWDPVLMLVASTITMHDFLADERRSACATLALRA